jgi:hypothetical protein
MDTRVSLLVDDIDYLKLQFELETIKKDLSRISRKYKIAIVILIFMIFIFVIVVILFIIFIIIHFNYLMI